MVTPRDARNFAIPEFSFRREGRFHSIRENLAILLAPVRLGAQAQGAQRFQFGSLWARPDKLGRAQWISLTTHGIFIAVLAFSVTQSVQRKHTGGTEIRSWDKIFYPGPPPKILVQTDNPGSDGGGESGGGERNPIPATLGRLARFARMQLTPPSLRRNPDAVLQVEATLIGPPNVPMPKSPYPNYGDPNAPAFTNSGGNGSGDGFGPNGIGGVGPGGKNRSWGDNPDGDGVGKRIAGQGASYPQCVYCPTPAYSEAGRKAKLQGQVELNVFVTAEGRVDRVEIIRGLGLGLDESAMQMVRTWRFRAAHDAANRPVGVWVPIEVTFRLL
jgi:TonB family protein